MTISQCASEASLIVFKLQSITMQMYANR